MTTWPSWSTTTKPQHFKHVRLSLAPPTSTPSDALILLSVLENVS
ncbi:hypothetical protein [Streptomyces sp. NPDC001744]